MDLNLDEVKIVELKKYFTSWQEIQERKKELAEENKEICKAAALLFNGKQTEASKLFKNMNQLCEGQDAEANNISILLGKIHGETPLDDLLK